MACLTARLGFEKHSFHRRLVCGVNVCNILGPLALVNLLTEQNAGTPYDARFSIRVATTCGARIWDKN